jgi:hypothetical protein
MLIQISAKHVLLKLQPITNNLNYVRNVTPQLHCGNLKSMSVQLVHKIYQYITNSLINALTLARNKVPYGAR